jgi:hypothetical protein
LVLDGLDNSEISQSLFTGAKKISGDVIVTSRNEHCGELLQGVSGGPVGVAVGGWGNEVRVGVRSRSVELLHDDDDDDGFGKGGLEVRKYVRRRLGYFGIGGGGGGGSTSSSSSSSSRGISGDASNAPVGIPTTATMNRNSIQKNNIKDVVSGRLASSSGPRTVEDTIVHVGVHVLKAYPILVERFIEILLARRHKRRVQRRLEEHERVSRSLKAGDEGSDLDAAAAGGASQSDEKAQLKRTLMMPHDDDDDDAGRSSELLSREGNLGNEIPENPSEVDSDSDLFRALQNGDWDVLVSDAEYTTPESDARFSKPFKGCIESLLLRTLVEDNDESGDDVDVFSGEFGTQRQSQRASKGLMDVEKVRRLMEWQRNRNMVGLAARKDGRSKSKRSKYADDEEEEDFENLEAKLSTLALLSLGKCLVNPVYVPSLSKGPGSNNLMGKNKDVVKSGGNGFEGSGGKILTVPKTLLKLAFYYLTLHQDETLQNSDEQVSMPPKLTPLDFETALCELMNHSLLNMDLETMHIQFPVVFGGLAQLLSLRGWVREVLVRDWLRSLSERKRKIEGREMGKVKEDGVQDQVGKVVEEKLETAEEEKARLKTQLGLGAGRVGMSEDAIGKRTSEESNVKEKEDPVDMVELVGARKVLWETSRDYTDFKCLDSLWKAAGVLLSSLEKQLEEGEAQTMDSEASSLQDSDDHNAKRRPSSSTTVLPVALDMRYLPKRTESNFSIFSNSIRSPKSTTSSLDFGTVKTDWKSTSPLSPLSPLSPIKTTSPLSSEPTSRGPNILDELLANSNTRFFGADDDDDDDDNDHSISPPFSETSTISGASDGDELGHFRVGAVPFSFSTMHGKDDDDDDDDDDAAVGTLDIAKSINSSSLSQPKTSESSTMSEWNLEDLAVDDVQQCVEMLSGFVCHWVVMDVMIGELLTLLLCWRSRNIFAVTLTNSILLGFVFLMYSPLTHRRCAVLVQTSQKNHRYTRNWQFISTHSITRSSIQHSRHLQAYLGSCQSRIERRHCIGKLEGTSEA